MKQHISSSITDWNNWNYPEFAPKNPYVTIGQYIFENKLYVSIFDVKENKSIIYEIEYVKSTFMPSELLDMGKLESRVKINKIKEFPYDLKEEEIKMLIGKDKGLMKAFKQTILDLLNDTIQEKIKERVETLKRNNVLKDYDWYKKWIIKDFKYPQFYYSAGTITFSGGKKYGASATNNSKI